MLESCPGARFGADAGCCERGTGTGVAVVLDHSSGDVGDGRLVRADYGLWDAGCGDGGEGGCS